MPRGDPVCHRCRRQRRILAEPGRPGLRPTAAGQRGQGRVRSAPQALPSPQEPGHLPPIRTLLQRDGRDMGRNRPGEDSGLGHTCPGPGAEDSCGFSGCIGGNTSRKAGCFSGGPEPPPIPQHLPSPPNLPPFSLSPHSSLPPCLSPHISRLEKSGLPLESSENSGVRFLSRSGEYGSW